MKDDFIKVSLFKHSKDSFLSLLDETDIHYNKMHLQPGVIVATGEAIEIIKAFGEASVFPALATIIVQWLKARSSRKVILQTKDKSIIHLEGYSVKDVQKVLVFAENLSIIDTEPNKK